MASSPWIHGYIHGIYVFFFFNFFLVDERESQGESGRVSVSVKERCQKIGKRQRCYTKLQMKHSLACTCVRMLRYAQYSKIRASAQHDKENEFKWVEESKKKIND